jgi:hypothetical protein
MKSVTKVTTPSFKELSDLALVILKKGLDLPPDHKEWLVDISMGNFRQAPITMSSKAHFSWYYMAFVRSVAYKLYPNSTSTRDHIIYTPYGVAYRYSHGNS